MDELNQGQAPDAGNDFLSDILGGTSQSEPASTAAGQASQQGAQPTSFKFGGRDYKSQQEAEAAHNKLYGQYSQQQNLLNQLKAALKDPQKLAEFSKDPNMAQVLAKMGLQAAQEEVETEGQNQPQVPQGFEKYVEQFEVKQANFDLKVERWEFEQDLGRRLTPQENNAVMQLISRVPGLSYAEAWKLANHDKLLQEAQMKAGQTAKKPQVNRPAPKFLSPGGAAVDSKKKVTEMSNHEWRETLRSDPDFQAFAGGSR